MLGLKGDQNTHKDKARSQGQKKLQHLEKVRYGHLDCWCNKSTLHQMFSKLKNQKNKLVTGKTLFFVASPFCTHHLICLRIGF